MIQGARERGVVSRAGTLYRVTVAAEMDMYPTPAPWVWVTPTLPGARDGGKVRIDEPWGVDRSRFASVIAAVVARIVALHCAAPGTA
ncbi:MAG: hypothetical protein LAP86_23750 [Acidobacteriia bacterium]|nr:hypothetical protein [Terriglobia bacterium]